MPTWPSTLPQSLLYTLTRKRQSGKVRSDMDTGPAKQRARFSATVRQYDAELILTGAQLTTFATFYDTTIGQGAESFTWIDPVTDVAATLRFMSDPEDVLIVAHDDPDERQWRVRFQLEQLP